MKYFNKIYGLRTKSDPTSENGGLFLAQYAMSNPVDAVLRIFSCKMQKAKQTNGMYARSANHLSTAVSHDEITGMMATSEIFNTPHRKEIWKQLKVHLGAYPAIIEDKFDYLPFNPSNYYAWGQYAKSIFSYIFLPFYLINMIIAMKKNKQNTSSKLIYNLELNTMPKNYINNKLKGIFEKEMNKQYGNNYLLELRKIYFHQEDENFPLFDIKGAVNDD